MVLLRSITRPCLCVSSRLLLPRSQCLQQRSLFAAKQHSNQNQNEPPAADKDAAQQQNDSASNDEPPKPSIDELTVRLSKSEETVKTLDEDKKTLTDRLKRVLAENDNTVKRYERQLTEAKQFAVQRFAKELLEPVDVLHKALESVEQPEADAQLQSLYSGVQMTHDNLLRVFKSHGLVQVNPIGEMFDPNQHEAMVQMPATKEATKPGQIAAVLKIGYSLHGRPIRPAQVAVVKS